MERDLQKTLAGGNFQSLGSCALAGGRWLKSEKMGFNDVPAGRNVGHAQPSRPCSRSPLDQGTATLYGSGGSAACGRHGKPPFAPARLRGGAPRCENHRKQLRTPWPGNSARAHPADIHAHTPTMTIAAPRPPDSVGPFAKG